MADNKSGPEVVPPWKAAMEQAGFFADDPPREIIRLFSGGVGIAKTYAWELLRRRGGSPSPEQQTRIVDFCQTIIDKRIESGQIKNVG